MPRVTPGIPRGQERGGEETRREGLPSEDWEGLLARRARSMFVSRDSCSVGGPCAVSLWFSLRRTCVCVSPLCFWGHAWAACILGFICTPCPLSVQTLLTVTFFPVLHSLFLSTTHCTAGRRS